MIRVWSAGLAMLALTACDPQVPDSAAGVGFTDYNSYRAAQSRIVAEREAQLTGQVSGGVPEATGAPAASSAPTPGLSSQDLAAAGIGTQTSGSTATVTPAAAAPMANTAAVITPAGSNAGISDEQNFDAVAGRESIESDAERLARQKAQFVAVTPTAVPSRPSDTGPDIVAYALSTDNQVGQKLYSRGLTSASRSAKNCGKYQSADLAQLAFLDAGGPQKDRLKLDPDGDGFACAWSPNGFRNAVRG